MTENVSEGEFIGRGPPGFRGPPRGGRTRRPAIVAATIITLAATAVVVVVAQNTGDRTAASSTPSPSPPPPPTEESLIPPPPFAPTVSGDCRGRAYASIEGAPSGPLIAYTADGDIHVWSMAAQRDLNVTASSACAESSPAFRSARRITFAYVTGSRNDPTSVLVEADLSTGRTTEILEMRGWFLLAHAWHRQGQRLAIIAVDTFGEDATFIYGGDPLRELTVGPPICQGQGPVTAAAILPSPRSNAFASIATDRRPGCGAVALIEGRSYFFHASDVAWLDGDHILYLRSFEADEAERRWRLKDVRDGSERSVDHPLDWRSPTVAPGSALIAWETSYGTAVSFPDGEAASIRGFTRPHWLDEGRLIVVDAGSCDNCTEPTRIGAGAIFDVRLGTSIPISLPRAPWSSVWTG